MTKDKHFSLRRLLWLLLLLVPLLAACGGTEPATESQPAADETVQQAAPVSGDLLAVSGKPQLVEFYADW